MTGDIICVFLCLNMKLRMRYNVALTDNYNQRGLLRAKKHRSTGKQKQGSASPLEVLSSLGTTFLIRYMHLSVELAPKSNPNNFLV